uniref:Uncharacterized protein n=1 Tax=Acetobacter pasteurianus TaxID=438 RepID=I3W065_ACEPA|nr:hypothetical protein [Acetobacter pasteurianus]
MKHVFLGSLAISVLGIILGIPDADMFMRHAAGQSESPMASVGGLVVLSTLAWPIIGLLLLVQGYVRLLGRLHRRMVTRGIFSKDGRP